MKVALARALVHRPQNLILDEPTRGLDIFAVRMLRELLKRLSAEGVCIVMSNHALAEVMELSDQVVMIADGIVKASGPPAELMGRANARSLEDAFVAYAGGQDEEGRMKWIVVFMKEMVDALRDRKALTTACPSHFWAPSRSC